MSTAARSLVIATAGHVDHGKTSLVKRLTGTDTDTLAEERERGVSINLGFAYSRRQHPALGELIFGFVDVPGHVNFINNMIAGVGAVHYGLLVVAADDGIMPQTREHLAILEQLGIRRGLVALSKIDRVDADREAEVTAQIQALLADTALSGAAIVPLSSRTGAGIEDLEAALLALVDQDDHEDADGGRPRFLIDRSFSVKGIGTVVTGTLLAGELLTSSSLLHAGSGKPVRVRGLRLHDESLERGIPGQRLALQVDLPVDSFARGDWLLDSALLHPVHRFDAQVRLMADDTILRSGSRYHLYLNASHRTVSLRQLDDGHPELLQIKCDTPLFVCHGDRFVLRDPADTATLGGGRVLDCFVPRRQRSSPARLSHLEALTHSSDQAALALLEQNALGLDLNYLAVNNNLSDAALDRLTGHLQTEVPGLVSLATGDRLPTLLYPRHFATWRQALLAALASHHVRQANKQGMSLPELTGAMDFSGRHELLQALVEKLLADGEIERTGTLLHLPGHKAKLSAAEEQFLATIRPRLQKAGWVPPRTRELQEATGIPLRRLEEILKELTRSGSLIQVADNRHYLPETIMELAEFTEELAQKSDSDEGFTVIQFRDASKIGRNLCIEILEYFDGRGFTRREENTRFLRTDKTNLFSRSSPA